MLLGYILILYVTTTVHTEFFSSSSHLKTLFQIEGQLANNLRDYIKNQESRLKKIKDFTKKIEHLETISNNDVASYVGHPVNTYSMISRMVKRWKNMENIVRENNQNGMSIHLCVSMFYFEYKIVFD